MIVGMMRVKNEARWIARSLISILPICDKVLVMDDHSTDETEEIVAQLGGGDVYVFTSPFTGLNEVRDKNHLLDLAIVRGADWILCVDGDEALSPASVPILREVMASDARCISMRIPYLWDREDQIRVDGVYGEFRRHSAFRPGRHRYQSTSANGFHCGNVPIGDRAVAVSRDDIHLLHFGYMHAADRARKYAWYNAVDPANEREDRYRHIAAGLDVPYGYLLALQTQMREAAGMPVLKDSELIPAPPRASDKTAYAGPLALIDLG